jgi:hypothetical protein
VHQKQPERGLLSGIDLSLFSHRNPILIPVFSDKKKEREFRVSIIIECREYAGSGMGSVHWAVVLMVVAVQYS